MGADSIIEVEGVSKQYRLGQVSTGTISHDINRWWARMRGKEDPTLRVTHSNDRTKSVVSKNQETETKNRSQSDYVWALQDINFEVKRGEVLGIIGRNGAGKSTLLKILSRVTAPTTGEIRVDGRIASLLEVGTGFHPELTGRENIFLNGAILGMTKTEIRNKLDEIVEFSGCARYLDTPVKRYSSGMMVRLGFAVAAHLEPDILIVDEVLAVGDAEFQKKCIGKMKDVASHGRTVLFVSHNLAAVEMLCPSCAIISEGRLTFRGETEQALHLYRQQCEVHRFESLADRSDRSGLGMVVCQNLSFFKQNQEPLTTLSSGKYVQIKVEYTARCDVSNPNVSITLYSESGVRVLFLNSRHCGTEISVSEGKGSFVCSIESFPLLPGEYSLNVAVASDEGMQDHVLSAAKIRVSGTDIHGTGILPTSSDGVTFCREAWEKG